MTDPSTRPQIHLVSLALPLHRLLVLLLYNGRPLFQSRRLLAAVRIWFIAIIQLGYFSID